MKFGKLLKLLSLASCPEFMFGTTVKTDGFTDAGVEFGGKEGFYISFLHVLFFLFYMSFFLSFFLSLVKRSFLSS